MRKWLIIVITFFILAASGAASAGIYAADDDLYQNLDEVAQQSNNDYFVRYRDNYQLDTETTSFFKPKEMGSVIFNLFANLVFFLQKMLATLTIAFFSFSLTTNISTMLGSYIEPFISAMKSSIWDSLAIYAIGFAAFILLLKMAQNRTAQALSNLISIVLIIALAVMFYAYPIDMLTGIDEATTGIANTVMEGPYQAAVGGKAEDAKGKANALCWNLFVHMPWQILEFGSVKTAEKYQNDILKLDPGSDERQELVDKLAKSDDLFSKSLWFQTKRIGQAVILLIFNLMLMIILMGFSALIIGYQFLLLIYLVLGIFVFLAALIPSLGLLLIRRWASRILGICCTRILVVFFLSIVLVFMEVIYKFTDEYGLLTTMFLILVIVFSLWFERYKLFELFSGFQSNGIQVPQQMLNRGLEFDWNAISGAQTAKQKIQKLDYNQVVEKAKAPVDYVKGKGEQIRQYRASNYEQKEAMKNQALGYANSATESLEKNYQYLRSTVGEADSFVDRTIKARKTGIRQFDDKDTVQMRQIMHDIDKQGLSVDNIVYDGKKFSLNKEKKLSRPQSLDNVASFIGNVKASTEKVSTFMGNVSAPKISSIDYFKNNFGEEKGEEIYQAMVTKYGAKVVESYSSQINLEEPESTKAEKPILEEQKQTKKSEKAKFEKLSYAQVLKQLSEKATNAEHKKQPQAVNLRGNEGKDAVETRNKEKKTKG